MNIADAVSIIETYLKTNWTTPIAWKNIPANDIDTVGQPKLEDGQVSWIYVDYEPPISRPIEIPVTCTRYTMFMNIEINVKEDTGQWELLGHIDALSDLLEFKTLSGVKMKEITSVGSFKIISGWLTEIIQIPFEFDRAI